MQGPHNCLFRKLRVAACFFAFVCLPWGPYCSVANVECRTEDVYCNPISGFVLFATRFTDRWIVVGFNGNIGLSQSGQTDWASFGLAGNNLRAVTYGAPGFVAVGDAGRIVFSKTGLNGDWANQTSGSAINLLDVTYGNGLYVAVGGIPAVSSIILTSPDGISWTDRSIGLSNQLDRVIFANNQFYSVGMGGVRASSADGISWGNDSAGPNPWTSVVFGNGIFLIADDASSIHTSATFAGFPNATGSVSAAAVYASVFIPERSIFVLVGDTGQTYTTTNGVGAANPGDIASGVPSDIDTDGYTTSLVSQAGYIEYSTDAMNFNPYVLGSADWYGIVHAKVPVELDP